MLVCFSRDCLVGPVLHPSGSSAEVEDAVGHRLIRAGAAAIAVAVEVAATPPPPPPPVEDARAPRALERADASPTRRRA